MDFATSCSRPEQIYIYMMQGVGDEGISDRRNEDLY